MAHHAGQLVVDDGQFFQVEVQVSSENSQVGQPEKIGAVQVFRTVTVPVEFGLALNDIVVQQLYILIFFGHFGRTEPDAAQIDVDRTHDPPAAGLLHPAPVLERIAGQDERRNGRNRIVEILYLDRIQRHF